MIESNSVEVGPQLTGSLPRVCVSPAALARSRALTLTLVVMLALAVRVFALGASGFSEDEINKLRAAESYGRFDFTANAEHPMLMKLAIWASFDGAGWWNAHDRLAGIVTISPEASLRFPNAIAGAATAGAIYLLAELLFDATVGAWASLFWALDANAAAVNRIGKEDTFLLLFLILAAYLYERGKTVERGRPASRNRWFAASGASFGLMLASKYMPHYFGLHTLYNLAADWHDPDRTPDKRLSFFAAMGGAFLLGNVAVLLPASWRYIAGYLNGDTLRHSGYDFAHRIYVNTLGASPWGVPSTFYITFLAMKVPLFILAAAAVGVVWAARHPDHRGAAFIRVFLVFTLLPYSFVASKFLRYMLPILAVVDIAAAVGLALALGRIEAIRGPMRREALAAAVASLAIGIPFVELVSAAPYYGLAQNALGARLAPPGSVFPDDELYDAGVRETVAAISAHAAPRAVICSDATVVVTEYLARNGRGDIRSCSIAHDGLPTTRVQTWVVEQPGHIYFENQGVIEQLRARLPPWMDVQIGGASAAQVFLFQP
jgi:dolichyl-phosphate-mannose-protein mannosyltransferase